MKISRRDFLKMGGSACLVMGAGAALAGCSPSSDGGSQGGEAATEGEFVVGAADINWAKETEILIIGTGIAGLSAAMKPALCRVPAYLGPGLPRNTISHDTAPPLLKNMLSYLFGCLISRRGWRWRPLRRFF